jgi:hypothetical protein
VEAEDRGYSEISLPGRWEEVAGRVKHPKEDWDAIAGAYSGDD